MYRKSIFETNKNKKTLLNHYFGCKLENKYGNVYFEIIQNS